ncbi:MAG: Rrf2 family transcriptional regulator [Alphaproteobacteria bacterium]|nr:Rrf2 family transcriptional regulator [Alphaproteobacteria bacterium]
MATSTRFAVGVHILLAIDALPPGRATSAVIAHSVNTNPVVVRRMFGMLSRAGLMSTRPGAGGARLARPLDRITLLDVWSAAEPATPCALVSIHEHPNKECPVGAHIADVLREATGDAENAFAQRLARVRLSSLAAGIRARAA